MMAKATGDKKKVSWFNRAAASTKTAHDVATKRETKPVLSNPAGNARVRVRGLAASMEASARRLKAIAAERAATIATIIQINVRPLGQPFAANMAALKAKGSTKIECSHLIISRVIRRLRKTVTI